MDVGIDVGAGIGHRLGCRHMCTRTSLQTDAVLVGTQERLHPSCLQDFTFSMHPGYCGRNLLR